MERVLDELDNQEVHLRRLARRIDALKPAGNDLELQISRRLHASLEDLHAFWGDEAPLGWPNPTTTMLVRAASQRSAIEFLAEQVGGPEGGIFKEEIRRELDRCVLSSPKGAHPQWTCPVSVACAVCPIPTSRSDL